MFQVRWASQVSFGRRGRRMTLNSYFEEIETLEFQIQFSVYSGIDGVRRALARHETVKGLIAELFAQPMLANKVMGRILYLVPKASFITDLSLDESIAAYLYCLQRVEPLLALRASKSIRMTGSLLWSCWLASQIMELAIQIKQSINFTAVASNSAVSYSDAVSTSLDSTTSAGSSVLPVTVRIDSEHWIEPSFAA